MLFHLKGVISQEAEIVPDGQESLSNSSSLSGLREVGRKEGMLRADKAVGLKSPWANKPWLKFLWKGWGRTASSLLPEVAPSKCAIRNERWGVDDFPFEGWSGEVKLLDMVSHLPHEVAGLICTASLGAEWQKPDLPEELCRAWSQPHHWCALPWIPLLGSCSWELGSGSGEYAPTNLTHLWTILHNSHFIKPDHWFNF